MKKLNYLSLLALIIPFLVSSCLKEDDVPVPTVISVKMYMTDKNGKDSLITEVMSLETLKIVVETGAEICSVWPGGVRNIMKKKGTTIDSLDMFNHAVLINSDCYSDYGLVGAKGYKGTQTDGGWYVSYKYPNPGEFDLTLVITNHGYQSIDYKQVIVQYGKVMVK